MPVQASPMAEGKIEATFARFDRLGLGKDNEDVTDAQESTRRAELFTSVISTPPVSIPY